MAQASGTVQQNAFVLAFLEGVDGLPVVTLGGDPEAVLFGDVRDPQGAGAFETFFCGGRCLEVWCGGPFGNPALAELARLQANDDLGDVFTGFGIQDLQGSSSPAFGSEDRDVNRSVSWGQDGWGSTRTSWGQPPTIAVSIRYSSPCELELGFDLVESKLQFVAEFVRGAHEENLSVEGAWVPFAGDMHAGEKKSSDGLALARALAGANRFLGTLAAGGYWLIGEGWSFKCRRVRCFQKNQSV